jgi:predicted RNA binding protein YcfA (HicA-like mRNA interferase family)
MPKLGIFSGTEICDILRAQGFELVRQRGSHMVMQRRTGESIIRQSQLPRDLFLR